LIRARELVKPPPKPAEVAPPLTLITYNIASDLGDTRAARDAHVIVQQNVRVDPKDVLNLTQPHPARRSPQEAVRRCPAPLRDWAA
jgi:hypothetical protein